MQTKNEIILTTFSGELRSLMGQRDINESQLADEIHLSHVAIGNYTAGKSLPRADALFRLAKFFEVPMEQFFGLTSLRIAEGAATGYPAGGLKKTQLTRIRRQIDEAVAQAFESIEKDL